MKTIYDTYIDAILGGASINSQAKLAGVHMNILRRLLVEHPDYEKAKTEGKLRQKGITPKLAEMAKDHPAVAEVMAGATLMTTSAKYGIPATSLQIMIRKVHPGINLRHRDLDPVQAATLALKKAEKRLEKARAQSLPKTLSGSTA